ncbi:Transmembrane amino acid transporter protein [Popillia japonica]|uniref:Transmembrane amino acid transporter protein n=1 Tax=Popillia japonica TaxID=7064 RepID=A0AAW1L4A8_POPJA
MQDRQEKFPSTFTVDNFSSTTKLAQNEVKLPIGSKETINEKDDYNPFEHRQTEHATSTAGVLTHLMKGSLGTGILAMPNAFKNGGLVFSFVGTIVVGILCTHCVYLLVAASHEICRRSKQPVLGFSETAGAVFEHGPKRIRPWAGTAR